jgi:hypothetical protein
VGTVAAVYWRRQRYGRVELRWDHRVTAIVAVLAAAHLAIELANVAPTGPVYLAGLTLGLLIAGICLWSPYAMAQHLAFGLALATASALPLGLWIDVPIPPVFAEGLGAQPHPLVVLQPLILPSWLIVTGVVGHVRLARAFARPVLAEADAGRRDDSNADRSDDA